LTVKRRKLERQQVRVSVKRKATDISTRPAKIICQTLQETDESHLQPSDLKSISQSLYIITLHSASVLILHLQLFFVHLQEISEFFKTLIDSKSAAIVN
jgi:hypothetical protein